jgi:hypothetical protein
MRIEPRVMEGAGEEIWTQVECVFIPTREGRAALEFVKVQVPQGEFTAGPLSVEVSGAEELARVYRPRLSWAEPLPLLRVGEAVELTLLLSGWDPHKPLNFPLPFHIALSPSLILESGTPVRAEQGAVLVLRCIPLEPGPVSLPPPRLEYQGETLIAPPLRLTVREAPASGVNAAAFSPGSQTSQAPVVAQAPVVTQAPAFPPAKPPLLPFIRASYISCAERAAAYWKEGAYARALAALREGERDLGSGPVLASLRVAAEKALGLEHSYDEPWRPRLLLRVVSTALSFILVSLCLWSALRHFMGAAFRFPAYVSAALLFMGLLLGLGGVVLTGKGIPETGNKVVVSGGAAYRTPDYSSRVSAELREGQPALVQARTALWVYVETHDGLSGWIPRDTVVFYSY